MRNQWKWIKRYGKLSSDCVILTYNQTENHGFKAGLKLLSFSWANDIKKITYGLRWRKTLRGNLHKPVMQFVFVLICTRPPAVTTHKPSFWIGGRSPAIECKYAYVMMMINIMSQNKCLGLINGTSPISDLGRLHVGCARDVSLFIHLSIIIIEPFMYSNHALKTTM